MKITCDPNKRTKTIEDRGLDFMDSAHVFAGRHFTAVDDSKGYGRSPANHRRLLERAKVIVGWVQRGHARHVFTMRKANEREINNYRQRLDQD